MEKSIPERVHDLYYRWFPASDCPVTGKPQEAPTPCSSESTGNQCPASSSASYKHPHIYDVYGRRIDEQAKQQEQQQQQQQEAENPQGEVWKMPRFLYKSSVLPIPESPVPAVAAREEINPANRMPVQANQLPAPGQKEPLPTKRQVSTIPKGGTEETWLYPSQQMFFNSLVRKNKADDVSERDMEAVVATHNMVNESTWARLLEWEAMYARIFPGKAQEQPRLLRFMGKPHELSPKARVKKFLGYGEPFDRHDWTVDRGGREMRYVIDFYYDEKESEEKWPFQVDVRPALDSPVALLLRARMMMHDMVAGSGASSSPSSSRQEQRA